MRLVKKFQKTMMSLKKMRIVGILGHFWPVFGLLWPRFECLMVQMSIFVLLLSGMSETDKKISNNDDKVEKTPILAIFGHFWPVFGL